MSPLDVVPVLDAALDRVTDHRRAHRWREALAVLGALVAQVVAHVPPAVVARLVAAQHRALLTAAVDEGGVPSMESVRRLVAACDELEHALRAVLGDGRRHRTNEGHAA